jgi:alcohol dehydrogenase (NADP+)
MTITIGWPDKHGTTPFTHGGFARSIVVHEHFALRIPANLNLAGAAPLLCAGITTYSPMRQQGVSSGMKVGVVGLGGLGHMAIKFARALGAHVAVFTTSRSKKDSALELGAHEVVISTDADEMSKQAASFDFILDTVSAVHDINAYIRMLGVGGNLTLVGISDKPYQLFAGPLMFGRRSISGTNFGGIPETQEMLDFCGQHNITADVEVISIAQVNESLDRLATGDVKYRFAIDMSTLHSA